jgi:hypothetical protein
MLECAALDMMHPAVLQLRAASATEAAAALEDALRPELQFYLEQLPALAETMARSDTISL